MVRRVFPNGTITLFAGNTTAGYWGDGGQATRAMLTTPTSVAISSDTMTGGGSVFIAGVSRQAAHVGPESSHAQLTATVSGALQTLRMR